MKQRQLQKISLKTRMMSMSMRSDLLLTKSNPLWMRSWARVTWVVKLLRRPGKRVLDSRILLALSRLGSRTPQVNQGSGELSKTSEMASDETQDDLEDSDNHDDIFLTQDIHWYWSRMGPNCWSDAAMAEPSESTDAATHSDLVISWPVSLHSAPL